MSETVAKLAEQANDEASFLLFVRELARHRRQAIAQEKENPSSPYGPDAGGWENTSIEHYLEAAVAWAEDSDFGRRMAFEEFQISNVSESRRFAAFLMAGVLYE